MGGEFRAEPDSRPLSFLSPRLFHSCWTFSGVEAIESALWLSTGKLFTLSEQEFVSCTSNPEHCGGTGGCFGATQDILYEYVLAHGFTLERDYPYVSGNGSEPMCLNQPLHVGSIAGYVDLPPNDLAAHLLAVNSQPLAISLDASDFHNYHSGVLTFQVSDAHPMGRGVDRPLKSQRRDNLPSSFLCPCCSLSGLRSGPQPRGRPCGLRHRRG